MIAPVLEEVSSFISDNELPWDVIIAVDGNDGTEDIINAYNKKFPFINSKKSSGRSGMGGAIKRGMLASTGEYLILMDGDGSSNLQSILRIRNTNPIDESKHEVKRSACESSL